MLAALERSGCVTEGVGLATGSSLLCIWAGEGEQGAVLGDAERANAPEEEEHATAAVAVAAAVDAAGTAAAAGPPAKYDEFLRFFFPMAPIFFHKKKNFKRPSFGVKYGSRRRLWCRRSCPRSGGGLLDGFSAGGLGIALLFSSFCSKEVRALSPPDRPPSFPRNEERSYQQGRVSGGCFSGAEDPLCSLEATSRPAGRGLFSPANKCQPLTEDPSMMDDGKSLVPQSSL